MKPIIPIISFLLLALVGCGTNTVEPLENNEIPLVSNDKGTPHTPTPEDVDNELSSIMDDNWTPHIPDGLCKEKLSKENRAIVAKRKTEILAELATLNDHLWAGSYNMYDIPHPPMVEYEFFIAPQSGYVYTCRSADWIDHDGGVLYEQNYGSITWENDRLKLLPVLKNEGNTFEELATEFILIPWGDGLYLVPADGIIAFCNAINSQEIYNFSRGAGWSPREGMPGVPDEFKSYLLENPVKGNVIAIGKTEEKQKGEHRGQPSMINETVITINKGKQDGLLLGMKLHVTAPAMFEWIELTDVSEMESEGIFRWHKERVPPQTG